MMTHALTWERVPRMSSEDADDPLQPLMDAAKGGDERAFAELCTVMRPRLYRVALAVLKDPTAADDIAQEALVRALRKRWMFQGRGTVKGWMTTIALNLAKNRLRDAGRRRALLREDRGSAEALTVAEAPRSPSQALDEDRRRAALWDAVGALPDKQRDVVRLRLLGELSFKDIGRTLDMREDAARQSFAAAKKILTRTLREQEAA